MITYTTDNKTKGAQIKRFNGITKDGRAVHAVPMMFVAQFPSQVASEVIKNSGTKIVHRLAWPDDIVLLGDSLGLSKDQRVHVTRLKVGEAVVGLTRIQKPILVQVKPDFPVAVESKDLSLRAES